MAQVEWMFGKAPKWMRFDNGKELVDERTRELAVKKGMEIQTMAPYSPSHNGMAECVNHSLLNLAHSMFLRHGLPPYLWDKAVSHGTYLCNHMLTSALPEKNSVQSVPWKEAGYQALEAWT